MSLKIGDTLPSITLKIMGEKGPQDLTTEALFANKKVVLFAVPGAFTPGCSNTHLPGYIILADKIKAKGVDTIACLSVNDAFVMHAWGKGQNAEEILMVADGNADFTKAIGMDADSTAFGMGTRSKRYAMIVENGKVTHLAVEPPRTIDGSSAEKILEAL